MADRAAAVVRIGTRSSRLALAQGRGVRRELERRFPSVRFRLVKVSTLGDEYQSVELFKRNLTGVFTGTLERKLVSERIDVAVHSLKDLPTDLASGLELAAVPRRLDPADLLITRRRLSLKDLPRGARVGTGSPRRKRQLAALRPDLVIEDIHGNLDTRVRKVLREKRYDAIVVARAGLVRLGRYLKYAVRIPPEELLPAVGQAALGLEVRRGDKKIYRMVRRLNHAPSETAVLAEREFLKRLGGGCRVPAGVFTRIRGSQIRMKAVVLSPVSRRCLRAEARGPVKRAGQVAARLAAGLLRRGAAQFLREARRG